MVIIVYHNVVIMSAYIMNTGRREHTHTRHAAMYIGLLDIYETTQYCLTGTWALSQVFVVIGAYWYSWQWQGQGARGEGRVSHNVDINTQNGAYCPALSDGGWHGLSKQRDLWKPRTGNSLYKLPALNEKAGALLLGTSITVMGQVLKSVNILYLT